MKKIHIILGVLVVIGIIVWAIKSDWGGSSYGPGASSVIDAGDPLDAALAFYQTYLDIEQNVATEYEGDILKDPILADDVRAAIETHSGDVDQVLCQSETPEKIRAKVLFRHESDAQVQVLGRGEGEKSPEQAVVTLAVEGGAWRITKIECLYGEMAPEREFSFENDGYLLKSVPAPLDSRYWHIVFEQNGQLGYTAPLFFSTASMCTDVSGNTAMCDENTFVDATKVRLQGQMTEAGVEVKNVTMLEGE